MTKIQYRKVSVDGYEAQRRGKGGSVIHATIEKVPVTGSTLHRPDLSKLQIED
jgi:hypothetical protein